MRHDDEPIEFVVVPVSEPVRPEPAEDVIDVGRPRRLDLLADRVRQRVRARVGRLPLRVRFAAAGGALLLLAGGLTAWQLTRPAAKQPVAAQLPAYAEPGPQFAWRHYDAPRCPAGSLAGVAPNPPKSAVAALDRHLPGFFVRYGSQTFDEHGRTCGTSLHARDMNGIHVIVLVSAPPNEDPPGQTMSLAADDIDVVFVTHSGWRVEISVFGPSAALPRLGVLTDLAHDPSLLS